MKKTKILTLSAALTALIVVLMFLGSLVEVLDLVTVFLASLLLVFAVIEFGGSWPWLIYGASSILGLLILPSPFAPCEFAMVMGLLPMLKNYFERLPRAIAWVLKFVAFNILYAAALAVFYLLLGIPYEGITLFGLAIPAYVVPIILAVLGNIFCLCYDILLTKLITIYYRKYRDRVRRRLRL